MRIVERVARDARQDGWWPDIAIVVFVFLLYTNIPSLLHQAFAVPTVIAGAYILVLTPALLHVMLRGHRLRVDAVLLLMVLFLAVLLASSLRAPQMPIAIQRITTYVMEGLVLYWLVVNVIRRTETLRRVVWTLLLAGGLLGALSLSQAITGTTYEFGGLASRDLDMIEKAEQSQGQVLAGRPLERYRGADRAEGPVDEPNRYAQLMIVLLPLAMLELRAARRGARVVLLLALATCILCGILLSYSRGASLALVPLAIALAVVGWVRPTRLVGGAIIVSLAVAVVAPSYYQRVATIAAATSVLTEGSAAQADGAIRGRVTEMLAATHASLDHPILGVGPGQYAKVFSRQYHQLPGIQYREIRGTRRAHSLYLELAADTGFVGSATFLAIVMVLMAALWRERVRNALHRPDVSALATGLWLSVFIYMITGVFLHLAFERYFWFLLALASAGVHVARSEEPWRPSL